MEKTLQQKQLEFLEETVAFYSVDPVGRRSLKAKGESGPDCRYRNSKGNKCAIGRHIPDDLYQADMEAANGIGSFLKFYGNCLPLSVVELGNDFLYHMQALHDVDDHWNENGLTKIGENVVTRIKRQFRLDEIYS